MSRTLDLKNAVTSTSGRYEIYTTYGAIPVIDWSNVDASSTTIKIKNSSGNVVMAIHDTEVVAVTAK